MCLNYVVDNLPRALCSFICAERAKRAERVCIFDGLRLLVGAVLVGSIFSEKAETVQNTAD